MDGGVFASAIAPCQGSALATDRDHQRLDALERALLDNLPAVHMPVEHIFNPRLYCRKIFMPAGTLLTSKIHRLEHPYVVASGRVRVVIAGGGFEIIEAGHAGITMPGTRRLLFIEEDCIWLTYHVLSPEEEQMRQNGSTIDDMLAAIEERIIEPHLHLDGADAHREYLAALEALGLPGVHEGPRALEGGVPFRG
jgi:hypothetical protein